MLIEEEFEDQDELQLARLREARKHRRSISSLNKRKLSEKELDELFLEE